MTDSTGNTGASAESATAGRDETADQPAPGVVIKDKRKLDANGQPKTAGASSFASASATASASSSASASGSSQAGSAASAHSSDGDSAAAAAATPGGAASAQGGESAAEAAGTDEPAADTAATGSGVASAVADDGTTEASSVSTGDDAEPTSMGSELAALRSDIDERTRDLQRLSAEYANYRKRVERDRGLVAEQATGSVLAALLPVLDDLDRARDHGDLVGPFGAVADQLNTALTKFGLAAFGAKGDPFDPTLHEAVAHTTSAEVTESTCVDVMRRGYLLGDRLLRPALVAVADPE